MKNFILLLSFIFAGCGDNNFRKVEELDGFRILAIQADSPEVAPGGTSTLQLFISDTKGPASGRIINGTTVSCIDPGIALGASVSCDHDPARVTGPYTIDTTAPDLLNNLFTGFSGNVLVNVPVTILVGRSAREQSNGVGYITIFHFTVDNQNVTAFKRVIATDRAALNTNPTGSAVTLNGATIAANPQKGDKLNLTTSIPEIYSYVNVDGSSETRSEEIDVAWFISDGEFNRPKTDLGQEVKLTEDPPPGPYLIISVVRDDRGGVEVVRTKIP